MHSLHYIPDNILTDLIIDKNHDHYLVIVFV